MNRALRGMRVLALTAAVLLLWCHGLDSAFMHHASDVPPQLQAAAVSALGAPTPAPPDEPAVSCCFGSAGSNLLSITLTKLPQVAAPLGAALLTFPLLLAAPRPSLPSARRLAPHRASLVAQSVLIRI